MVINSVKTKTWTFYESVEYGHETDNCWQLAEWNDWGDRLEVDNGLEIGKGSSLRTSGDGGIVSLKRYNAEE